MEKTRDQQTRTESKTQLVEQINSFLRSGDYSRALDLLRSTAAEFPNDAELSALEKLAQDGVKRNAEANRLITESQELFAQQKSAEGIQLLRKAYELDKRNSLARAILANALVEHAQSVVETDWLEAETLTNQALNLNPAHPTAKTILSLIVTRKEASSVEDWIARARKLQASSDPFAALAWVAEGLAVHPHDPKLLLIQDEIQRDQDARRRQARRGDLEDLRRHAARNRWGHRRCRKTSFGRAHTNGGRQVLDGWRNLVHRQCPATPLGISLPGEFRRLAARQKRDRNSSRPAPQRSGGFTRRYPPDSAEPDHGKSKLRRARLPPSPVPTQNIVTATVPPNQVPPSKVPPNEVRPRLVPPSIAPVRLVPTTPPQAATPPCRRAFRAASQDHISTLPA